MKSLTSGCMSRPRSSSVPTSIASPPPCAKKFVLVAPCQVFKNKQPTLILQPPLTPERLRRSLCRNVPALVRNPLNPLATLSNPQTPLEMSAGMLRHGNECRDVLAPVEAPKP
jgi:hypothetical protein